VDHKELACLLGQRGNVLIGGNHNGFSMTRMQIALTDEKPGKAFCGGPA
jgi:hypothetical protein